MESVMGLGILDILKNNSVNSPKLVYINLCQVILRGFVDMFYMCVRTALGHNFVMRVELALGHMGTHTHMHNTLLRLHALKMHSEEHLTTHETCHLLEYGSKKIFKIQSPFYNIFNK